MDTAFETAKKLNYLNLQAALKRLDKDTGYIYFDEKNPFCPNTKKAPVIENLSYVLCLFNQKSQEGFQQAEKTLNKLLSFYKDGNFPKYLSDYPLMDNPYIGILAYPFFYQILKHFKSYLNKELCQNLKLVCEQIKSFAQTINPYHHLEPLVCAILDKPIQELLYNWESAAAFMISNKRPKKLLSQKIKFTENGHLMLSPFDFIKAQTLGEFDPDLLEDHPLHLKLALFYEPFEKTPLDLGFFENPLFPEGYVWKDSKNKQHVLSFCQQMSVVKEDHIIEVTGDNELQKEVGIYFPSGMIASQNQKRGTYFLKHEIIEVVGLDRKFKITSSQNLALVYEKRKEELFTASSLALKVQLSGPFNIRIECL